ncbi:hypothetical protein FB45DRAFT_899921 [Roridomyces roridus]|uniref:CRIB domain-containing protein n=1 Tax=Roridomyces roridus TaxID=1738132 RepID=A0AAD7FW43_9AGAR|nr:hypothetical protein FB45DRAFT_899921 [Roridomyces roridus]
MSKLYEDEVPSSKLCSLTVHIRFTIGVPSPRRRRGRRDAPPPPYSANQGQIIRTGRAHVKQIQGRRAMSLLHRINWLVLTDKYLVFKHNSSTCNTILLSDIVKLDRAESGAPILVLETIQGKRYLLRFKCDDDLYDWQDDIYLRITPVSQPWNFRHNVHVHVDASSGEYVGLPDEWHRLRAHSSDLVSPMAKFRRPFPVDNSRTLLRITMTDPVVSDGRVYTTLSV